MNEDPRLRQDEHQQQQWKCGAKLNIIHTRLVHTRLNIKYIRKTCDVGSDLGLILRWSLDAAKEHKANRSTKENNTVVPDPGSRSKRLAESGSAKSVDPGKLEKRIKMSKIQKTFTQVSIF